MTGLTITSPPELALLNIGMENIPHCFHTIITYIILASRLSIVRHWKSTNIPTKHEVVTLIHTNGSYKRMFTASGGKFSFQEMGTLAKMA